MQANKYSIKQWAKDDRPREKLLNRGPAHLSDSELLAILLNHGTKDKSAIDLAKEIMQLGKNNLNELGKLTVKELMKIRGIKEAKAITIAAALEIGRRRQAGNYLQKPVMSASRDFANYLQSLLRDHNREVFAVAFLNQANRINHIEMISEGGITGTIADPRVILKKALEENAVSLILCHNHPSGSLKPSKQDEEITRKIKEAARYFDIKLLDHIIVSDAGYYSFADEGIL
ncbi:MAG TPA: DNA repair protein RadC [Chitinophagaceae bacterium]|jgi:DNA repair protein RadC|nr:DNA repair protein RadC [Chitinophagaceae bacterium]